ncbi:MAG: sensor histidine kinase [Fulvimarina manganoxydans]|uniref:GAF domain-containing sensor histidine kinase n=1 Tax=Fulvimarina manganoxydans TaxID=937218 RepID=UPI0023556D7D|nr:sensor histidine kinase [Fulvimarina manganoxydans]MCK5934091.1 sensor histidine kinase [Fulvimarina manganoxydans]
MPPLLDHDASPKPDAPRADDTYLKIASHLAGHLDIRSALEAVVAEIGRIIEVDHVDVCLLDEDEAWCASYEVGYQTHWSRERTRVSTSPVRTILSGETAWMLTDDALSDERYVFPGSNSGPILEFNLRSRINVAMKVMGRTIGVLSCSACRKARYSRGNVTAIAHVADVLAPYFHALQVSERARQAAIRRAESIAREEGLRQGALELTSAMEQERQRIGMDLHDQTLADLTRLMREVEADDRRLSPDMIVARLSDAVNDLRRIIDEAVPTLLDMFGFAHAVRIHLERATAGTGIVIQVEDEAHQAIDRLGATTRTALFRIVQEAVNNAARHSQGSRIVVTIAEAQGRVGVTIEDDGRGMAEPPGETSGRSGQGGLVHMQTRARLIAADFAVESKQGTRVTVNLPLAAKPRGTSLEMPA